MIRTYRNELFKYRLKQKQSFQHSLHTQTNTQDFIFWLLSILILIENELKVPFLVSLVHW